jgi:outer membrane protein assembly factor BamC
MNSSKRLPSSASTRQTRKPCGRWTLLALASWAAVGCSVLQEDKLDYKSARQGSTLDVPPDLTQLSRDPRFMVPGAATSASGYQVAQPATSSAETAASKMGNVRIERSGNQRWLVTDLPAEKLWTPIKDFWVENNFALTLDQEKLGVMETDWAENRAKLPQDFIRSTLGKVFDSLYSTGELDKFRTRLERNASGGTEIYITHRGMIEVYADSRKEQTAWQPRPADSELEAEFLRRLMMKLGASESQAKASTAAASSPTTTQVVAANNSSTLQFSDNFDRAWRRVGLSLDRTGFTVEDRDRSKGLYFVRYVPATAPTTSKPGFLAGLFGSKEAQVQPRQYRIQVQTQGEVTTVSVLDTQGKTDSGADAQRIVKLLADDLK